MFIGAQMYTVREFTKNLDDFALTLQKIAEIGYKYVQVSGTCAFEAGWLKEQLDKTGLQCVLTHTPGPRIIAETEKVCAEHEIFGCRNIGLGWYAFDESKPDTNYENFISTYKPAAECMKQNGRYFMYHNHDQEFKRLDGKLVIEKMAEDMPKDLMGFTLDTFWVQAGGGDPAQWIEKLSGRLPVIHLKDFSYGRKMAVIGEGNINFERVFEKAETAGTQFMLVEQDDCNGENPFDCLKRSYDYLYSCGLR